MIGGTKFPRKPICEELYFSIECMVSSFLFESEMLSKNSYIMNTHAIARGAQPWRACLARPTYRMRHCYKGNHISKSRIRSKYRTYAMASLVTGLCFAGSRWLLSIYGVSTAIMSNKHWPEWWIGNLQWPIGMNLPRLEFSSHFSQGNLNSFFAPT